MIDRQSYFAAVLARDVKVAFRSGGGWFYAIFFFAIFVALSAIAIGPEMSALSAAAPAVSWLAAAFAIQFAAVDLFESDLRDQSLRAIASEQESLFSYWLAKVLFLAAIAAIPLAVTAPFMLAMLGVSFGPALKSVIILLIGLPALIFVAILTAALAAGLRAGGLLGTILAAPISVPVLVFGVSATERVLAEGFLLTPEILILAAFSLFMAVLTPIFSIAVLRLSLE